MADEIKMMDFDEFWKLGFVQEANRLFFHPRGLALSVTVEDGKATGFGGIWDYRDDPEGILFGSDIVGTRAALVKAAAVQNELERHIPAREKLLGFFIQELTDG
jgi:hypothetical protein